MCPLHGGIGFLPFPGIDCKDFAHNKDLKEKCSYTSVHGVRLQVGLDCKFSCSKNLKMSCSRCQEIM